MIWLTWRQHRKQALFALVGLGALAAFLVPTGLDMHHVLKSSGLAACLAKAGTGEFIDPNTSCDMLANRFTTRFGTYKVVATLLVFLPLVVGMFWGAPLVAREVETGTHRLVWTQGVSRLRWFLVKSGLILTAAAVLATVYSLLMAWWLDPFQRTSGGKFDFPLFDIVGPVPVAYTLFAVAVGLFAGTVWRKSLASMGVTLAAFLGARIAVAALARPRYLPALERTSPLQSDVQENHLNGDWRFAFGIRDAAGRLVMEDTQIQCSKNIPAGAPACGARDGLGAGAYNWVRYQPIGRYWTFQWIETGIFVALAALLLLFAIRQIRRVA